MPHKRNPVGCEQVTGLARLVRANALAALENVALWHERDISHSSVERVIIPDSFLAIDHMLRRFTAIVQGMAVDTARMRRNLESTRGLVFSGQLLLELTSKGMRREDAYRVVQAHAMEAWKSEGDFVRRVLGDPEIREVLTEGEIAEVFRLERYLTHVDAIFRRVFGSGPAPGPAGAETVLTAVGPPDSVPGSGVSVPLLEGGRLTSRQTCRNAVVFSLALLARSEAGAEGTSGGLLGWVEDARGTPVSGAMISLFGKGIGGRGLLTLTDSNGRFFLPSLPPGRYTLRALSEGQPSVVARQVTVLPNRDAVFTLSLTPIAAGAALRPVVATSPAEGESSRELEWLLRHKRRSALESRRNDAAELLRPERCPSGFRCPESREPSQLAGTFEFLAGPTSLSAGLSPTEENAASLGLVRFHGRIADSVRWSLGGLATESENATWRMGAEFIVEPGGGHELRAGSGYGARTMSPQLVHSDAPRDGESALERSTGSIFVEEPLEGRRGGASHRRRPVLVHRLRRTGKPLRCFHQRRDWAQRPPNAPRRPSPRERSRRAVTCSRSRRLPRRPPSRWP